MVASGNVGAIGEQFMKTLEALRVGRVALTGYSWGGIPPTAIAGVKSTLVEVVGLNIDETPNVENFRLTSDFMSSAGNLGDIVDDSNLEVIRRTQSKFRLPIDYLAFGIANYALPTGIATRKAMKYSQLISMLEDTKLASPDLTVKIGKITDSKIVKITPEVEELIKANPNFRLSTYSGEGAHMHGTGINPMAYALMVKEGLGNLSKS